MRTFLRRLGLVCSLTWFGVTPALAELESTRLSLPKGPGSIEGLASADFTPSLASGQASYSVPIVVPPAVRGFGPELTLSYDSGAGVSEVALGWRLSGLPMIRRRVEEGLPRFDETDTFEMLGLGLASELLETEPGVFRPRYEDGSFVRAERNGERWQVRTKAGTIYELGKAHLAEPGGVRAVYLLDSMRDAWGHEVRFEWRADGTYPLLERVVWNDFGPEHRNEVRFVYEARPDRSRIYSLGLRQELAHRLTSISVRHGGELVRRYELGYSDDAHPRLIELDVVGADGRTHLPTARFHYTAGGVAPDATGGALVEMQESPGLAPGDGDAALADLNGDGLPDLLVGTAGAYASAINVDGARWESVRAWEPDESPSFSLSASGVGLADFDGDGAVDLLAAGEDEALRYWARSSADAFAEEVSVDGALSFDLEDPNVRLVDLDGDRRTDVIRTTSSGLLVARNRDGVAFEPVGPAELVDLEQEVLFESEGTELCDINGDRVMDLCRLRSGSLVYYLGRGRGAFEAPELGSGVPEFAASEPFALRDLDGDGWDDLVRVQSRDVAYALARGEGRFGPVRTMADVPTRDASTRVLFADMNGSGSVDVVWIETESSEPTPWRYLELFPEGRAGLLSKIESGLGKTQTITYAPAASFAARARGRGATWDSRLNVSLPVVARVTVETGLDDPPLVQTYDYTEGAYDPDERGFAGFGVVVTHALGDDSTPTLVTERHFDLGLRHRPLRGALRSEEQRTEDGHVFSRRQHEYVERELELGEDGRFVEYGYRSATWTEWVEGQDGNSVTTLSEVEQDEFGNEVLAHHWGVVRGDDYLALGDESIVVRTFADDPEAWILGYPVSEAILDGQGQTRSLVRRYYDGSPFHGLPLGQITRGEVTREEAWVGPSDETYELVTATRYDEHGLPIETRDARGGGRFFDWDDAHTFVVREGVKLDADDEREEVLLFEQATFDGRFGQLTEIADYAGAVTRYEYDALGRVSAVIAPGDDSELPTVRYRYEPGAPLSRIVTESRVESGERATELREDVFDGLGRKRASFVLDAELWLAAGIRSYDARGQVRKNLLPRWVSEVDRRTPPLFSPGDGREVWRDALGREVRSTSAEGVQTRTSYEPLRVLYWDGGQADQASPFEHTPTVTVLDGRERVIRHERELAGERVFSSYQHDAAGRLLSRTDPEGHRQEFRYDGRGRRVEVLDPDQGRHTFAYDGAGNLLQHQYPDGGRTAFSYDLAGRLLGEDWDGDGTSEIAREYDRGTAYDRGRLVQVTEPSGGVRYAHDERGRVAETRTEIEGDVYVVKSRYDAQDREAEHVYPDGSSIELRRNARGQLSGYGELARIEYAADGAETKRRYSTGVELSSAHDRDHRRTGMQLRNREGEASLHLSWHYDGGGNLVRVVDEGEQEGSSGDRSATYEYDNLYRLTGVRGAWGSVSWSYSPSGNLVARTSTLPELDTGNFVYGARPHAPELVGERHLSYDARGQLTGDGERVYEWDAASRLTRVSRDGAEVTSVYGGDGARRIKREVDASGRTSTTHFIDPWSEVRDGQLVRYVVHAGERIVRLRDGLRDAPTAEHPTASVPSVGGGRARGLIAFGLLLVALGHCLHRFRSRRVAGGLVSAGVLALGMLFGCSRLEPVSEGQVITKLVPGDRLLVSDQVGSLLAEFDEQGDVLVAVETEPYGFVRQSGSSETHQYAGTPLDPGVGLSHMGARFYAPDLGLFTSGDPVSLTEPERQMSAEFAAGHSYAYANLRPTVAADRDGHFWQQVIGAGIGIATGGGGEALRQYLDHGEVQDWGRVAAAAASGGVAGLLASFAPPTGLAVAGLAGGVGSAVGGLTRRFIESGGRSLGSWRELATDFTVGAAGGMVAKGVSVRLQSPRPPKPPTAVRGAASAEGSTAGSGAATTSVAAAAGALGPPAAASSGPEATSEFRMPGSSDPSGEAALSLSLQCGGSDAGPSASVDLEFGQRSGAAMGISIRLP